METRTLDPDDVGRSLDIRLRSFGPLQGERSRVEAMLVAAAADRRLLGVYDGKLLVGRAIIWAFAQWWCGRVLPMAGIAGVIVAPDYRGRGVGSLLMHGVANRARDLGYPLSVLYPATSLVYRRAGWEFAGAQHRFSLDTDRLRGLRGGDTRVVEAGPDDAPAMLATMRGQYLTGRACGPQDDTEQDLRDSLARPETFAYLAPDGFVLYGWDGRDLSVSGLHAGSLDTVKALWSTVGSGSSVAKRVHAYLAPDDPILHVLGDAVAAESEQERWMLRVLDNAIAVAGRGFPGGIHVDVPLVVDDAQLPENSFSGRLVVADGTGALVPGPTGDDAVRCGPNGFAALFAGKATTILRAAGLLAGGSDADDAALDLAFAGRPTYLLDYF